MSAQVVAFPADIVAVDPNEAWVLWVERRRDYLAAPSTDNRAQLIAATHALIRATGGKPSDPGWRMICEDIAKAARSFGAVDMSDLDMGGAA